MSPRPTARAAAAPCTAWVARALTGGVSLGLATSLALGCARREAPPPAASSAKPVVVVGPLPLEPTALGALVAELDQREVKAPAPRELVGTQTGRAPDEGGDAELPPRSVAKFGRPTRQGDVSSTAVERSARADLYWTLVARCRGPDGETLPPDAVTLRFRLDESGAIELDTLSSEPSQPRYEDAASCMRRELVSLPYRGSAGQRGSRALVTMTVPSVD